MSAKGRFDPFAKPSRNGRYLRQAAIRNGPADESPSSLKSNSQSPRLAMPSRTEAPTVRQYGERYLWFESSKFKSSGRPAEIRLRGSENAAVSVASAGGGRRSAQGARAPGAGRRGSAGAHRMGQPEPARSSARRGRLQPTPTQPVVPCSDGAGTVEAVGPGCARVRPGDRVVISFFPSWIAGEPDMAKFASALGGPGDGVLRDTVTIAEEALAPLPPSVSTETAAALPCAALTAWSAVVEQGAVRPGSRSE